MKRLLIIAPHPDDETLGAGGALLRRRADGWECHWLIVTAMRGADGHAPQRMAAREGEIAAVAGRYGFQGVHRLGLPTARLETLPLGEVIGGLAGVLERVQPAEVLLPHGGDAHSDHRIVAQAAGAALKWFRAPWVRRVLAYETLSETGFGVHPGLAPFYPNRYVEITAQLAEKCAIMALYEGEMGAFPFPRSVAALEAQARLRGAACGVAAAEAFMTLWEREP